MKDFSYITNSHPAYIEGLYKDFVKDPASIDPDLKKFFEGFDFAVANGISPVAAAAPAGIDWMKEIRVYRLILGYRNKGHLLAKTNPIRTRKDRGANLELSFFGLSDADMDTVYQAGNLIGLGATSLRNILSHLEKTYATHVGIEFKYISDQVKVDWLSTEMEKNFSQPVALEQKKRILEKLNHGVMFEKFLHTKYIGQKRFSLEGGETTIAALDAIINAIIYRTYGEIYADFFCRFYPSEGISSLLRPDCKDPEWKPVHDIIYSGKFAADDLHELLRFLMEKGKIKGASQLVFIGNHSGQHKATTPQNKTLG